MNFAKTTKVLILCAVALAFGQSLFAQNRAFPIMPGPAAPGQARSYAWVMNVVDPAATVHAPGQPACNSSANACYYQPADLQTAYAIGSIANGNGGAGRTVAIVDAYYNSQTSADLDAFSSHFGLPTCDVGNGCLTIVNQTGGSCSVSGNCPNSNSGWAVETDLDLDAVHSIAPNAKILLVTGYSNSFADLGAAVLYAQANADVVTNSYGANEFSGESSNDSYYSGSTVPILFSSGDTGAVTEYPCTSIYALCIGGTNLLTTAASFRNVESAWGGPLTNGGGGCSSQIGAPSFEGALSTCGSARGVPDVSALADPYTGLVTYLGTFAAGGTAGFYIVGGTSLASPLTAGVIANIDNSRIAASKARLGLNLNALIYQAAGTYPAPYRYRFYDVTTGTNGFAATASWDKATGIGVILGPALAAYLVSLP